MQADKFQLLKFLVFFCARDKSIGNSYYSRSTSYYYVYITHVSLKYIFIMISEKNMILNIIVIRSKIVLKLVNE